MLRDRQILLPGIARAAEGLNPDATSSVSWLRSETRARAQCYCAESTDMKANKPAEMLDQRYFVPAGSIIPA
jgi:hypothetical protein